MKRTSQNPRIPLGRIPAFPIYEHHERKKKMEQKKKERKITPVGEARWAHVHEPKPPYKDPKTGREKGGPMFAIDVYFDPKTDQAWKDWANDISRRISAMPQQYDKDGAPIKKQMPIKPEIDQEDRKTGRFYVQIKTKADYPPGVFDAYGRPIPPEIKIGNGSKVKVAYTENEYDAFGGGINFYLSAVQVLELVEYRAQSAAAYGFDVQAPPEGNDDFNFGANTDSKTLGSAEGIGKDDFLF
ncbi:hypothetical protein KGP36_01880 [Patescibacteria group bacterium]|nr:hypothetical protein [Patescibacteria group bacterium]